MIAIVIVTGRDSIRITISIRNTSIVIMSVYSVLLLLLKLETGYYQDFQLYSYCCYFHFNYGYYYYPYQY